MLVAMDKVDRDFIDEMRQHFARLDVDGTGVLSKDDLIASARRKLQDPAYKLGLAQYKAQLLNQAAVAKNNATAAKPRSESGLWKSTLNLFSK
jgi:hypothetical protein